MNKVAIYESITLALKKRFETAQWSANQAYDAATNEESVAENKYDTFGLEASYLAHGQSQRVLECENDYLYFTKSVAKVFSEDDEISCGALVGVASAGRLNKDESEKWFFVSNRAGGLTVEYDGLDIFLVTEASPVGRVLLGKVEGDEINLKRAGQDVVYEVIRVL